MLRKLYIGTAENIKQEKDEGEEAEEEDFTIKAVGPTPPPPPLQKKNGPTDVNSVQTGYQLHQLLFIKAEAVPGLVFSQYGTSNPL